jgi:uncharacterized protein YbaP (TraB family)
MLAGIAVGQSSQSGQRAAPDSVNAHPALWVVRDADTTIYLFGTIHLLNPDISWFGGQVRKAFDGSGEIRLEAVMPQDPSTLLPTVMKLARDPQGRTLSSKMTTSQRRTYEAATASMGAAAEALEPFEAWFVGLQLAQGFAMAAGLDPALGADHTLQEAAHAAGKLVSGFETAEEQLRYLDQSPESEQIAGVVESLADPGKSVQQMQELVDSWSRGDVARTAAVMAEEMSKTPELAHQLIEVRNERWAAVIEQRLKSPGTLFVAVGIGHLVGARSVQSLLGNHGHAVTRIDR